VVDLHQSRCGVQFRIGRAEARVGGIDEHAHALGERLEFLTSMTRWRRLDTIPK
jgi:hypothetical protein